MKAENENDFDLILQRHFSTALEPQLGRASREFTQHVKSRSTHRFVILRAAISTAAAAMIALALMPRHIERDKSPRPVANASDGTLEQVVWSRTMDAGTVFLDGGTPARRVVREQVRELSWTDPSGVKHIRSVTPQTDVMLISLDKY